jgi:eukaryotic-like serine/threonine-protein kinase
MAQNERAALLRFGEFIVDPSGHSVRKHGIRLKLHGQPFEILLLLLEKPGEVVTREELQHRVWTQNTFVDFEQGLNAAIKKLRHTIQDSADEPRYIETVPRIGYRFIASVEWVKAADAEIIQGADTIAGSSGVRSLAEMPEGCAVLAPRFEGKTGNRILNWKWLALGAVIAAVIGIIAFRFARSRTILALGPSDLVLVGDFVNTTGDPVFDGTLKQALAVKLGESPYFNLVSAGKVRETLKLMGRSPDDAVVPPVARDVCQRAGAKALVGGAIFNLGDGYVIALDATNCMNGGRVTHQEIQALHKDQIIARLGEIIPPVRRELGESISSIQKFDTPIEQATTNSLAALKAYTVGDEKRIRGDEAESVTSYRMAVELDPNFAIAYARIGAVYHNLEEIELGNEYLKKGFDLRGHVSEKEKFYIAAHYYVDFTGEEDKAIDLYKLWIQTYPRDWIPYNNLGNELVKVGQPSESIAPVQEAIRLNPALSYNVAYNYLRASRFPEAKAICERAVADKHDSFATHTVCYDVAFVNGDEAAQQREVAWFKGKPLEYWILNIQGWSAFALGQVRRGEQLFERGRAEALRQGSKQYAVATANDQAQLEADLENTKESRSKAELAMQIMPDSEEAQAGVAIALARIGDVNKAQTLTASTVKRYPLNTLINDATLPCAYAAIDMHKKNPARAVEDLNRAVPYELGDIQSAGSGLPMYYRGLAYLQSGSGKEAAIQFQKLIDNRGIVSVSVYWPLAHLGLARAFVIKGDKDKALSSYREFLSLWKNADPDLHVLQQAKSEYAKLSGQK